MHYEQTVGSFFSNFGIFGVNCRKTYYDSIIIREGVTVALSSWGLHSTRGERSFGALVWPHVDWIPVCVLRITDSHLLLSVLRFGDEELNASKYHVSGVLDREIGAPSVMASLRG